MGSAATVRVEGLTDLRKALVAADRRLGPELRKGLNAAGEVVVDSARPRLPASTGALARSLRARSTQREGRVVIGSAKVPYAGWVEFGGRIRQPAQNRTLTRTWIPTGRVLFPAVARNEGRIRSGFEAVADRLTRTAGLR